MFPSHGTNWNASSSSHKSITSRRRTPGGALLTQARRRIYPLRSPAMVLNDILGTSIAFKFNLNKSKRLVDCQAVVEGRLFSVWGYTSKREAKEALAYKIIPFIVKQKNEIQSAKGPQIDRFGKEIDFYKREEETPWASLCSLALYKLFEDWTSKGYHVPDELYRFSPKDEASPHSIAPGGVGRIISIQKEEHFKKEEKMPEVSEDILALWKKEEAKTGKAMPPNPTSRNPIQLLNQIRPNLNFITRPSETGQNSVFKTSVEIEGSIYSGEAQSKRESKRLCAMKALLSVYRIEYSDARWCN